jgi:hypothetical protein
MSSDRLQTDPDLAHLRLRISSFPSRDQDVARRQELLTDLMVELLRRPETMTEFANLRDQGATLGFAQNHAAGVPYGVFAVGNREIELVAEELGAAVVARGHGDLFVDDEIVEIAVRSTAIDTVDFDRDRGGYYRQRASDRAYEAIGWAVTRVRLGAEQRRIPMADAIVEDHMRAAVGAARGYLGKAINIETARQLPALPAAQTEVGLNKVFRFSLPGGPRADAQLVVQMSEHGDRHDFAPISGESRSPLNGNYRVVQGTRHDGTRAFQLDVAMSVLREMGLNQLQAGALVSDATRLIGLVPVVADIEHQLRNGTRSVDISGAKLATWINDCNVAFKGEALAGYQTQDLPPIAPQNLQPGPAFGVSP